MLSGFVLTLGLALAADQPVYKRPPTPAEAEMQLLKEIEEEEARQKAAAAKGQQPDAAAKPAPSQAPQRAEPPPAPRQVEAPTKPPPRQVEAPPKPAPPRQVEAPPKPAPKPAKRAVSKPSPEQRPEPRPEPVEAEVAREPPRARATAAIQRPPAAPPPAVPSPLQPVVVSPEPAAELGGERVRLELGLPLTWRSADVKPDSGTGLSYRTGAPYAGVSAGVTLFPARLAGETGWLGSFGLAGAFSHRLVTSSVEGRSFVSTEQRGSGDVVLEHGIFDPVVLGARAGYGFHRFAISGADAPLQTAIRTGPRVGADLAVGTRYAFVAGVRWFPRFGAGGPEANARGAATGSGLELLAGVQGPLPLLGGAGFGWRVAYDLTTFSDTYSAAGGTQSSGGTGSASYQEIQASLTWRR